MKIAFLVSRRRAFSLHAAPNDLPTSVFWGLKELTDEGHEVRELSPPERPAKLLRYVPLIGDYLDHIWFHYKNRKALSDCDVAFTYVFAHALAIGLLRRLGITKTPGVYMIAGFQFLRAKGVLGRIRLAWEKWCLQGISSIVTISQMEQSALQKGLPNLAKRIVFYKFGTDAHYYQPSPTGKTPLIVSVGNDMDRDWETFFAAIERTNFASVAIMPPSRWKDFKVPAATEVLLDPPMSRTREILAKADIVVVSTRPGNRFSGITTAICGLQCKCLVIYDKVNWVDAYGFEDRVNYIGLKHGDVDQLVNILRELREKPALLEEIAQRGFELGKQLNIGAYAQDLGSLFRELSPQIMQDEPGKHAAAGQDNQLTSV